MERRKRILVICPCPEDVAPAQRLKYEQYFSNWRANGFSIEVSPFFSDRLQEILYKKGNTAEKIYWVIRGYLKRCKEICTLHKYDLVYIFLWVTPFGFPLMERLFVSRNSNIVYDIDDLIFMRSLNSANTKTDFLKGRKKPFFLMKKAKHVITCTPYLTEVANRYNNKVTDISSTINTTTYQPVNRYQNDHTLVLGWSGSHSTAPLLYLLKDALIALRKKHAFKLVVMGAPEFFIEGLDIELVPWSVENEIPTLQRFDIGLYPLLLNNDWMLGKSGLKALQYMAVGVPVVATALGANYRIIEEGKTGFLVKTTEEWIEKIEFLMTHPEIRKAVGSAGRDNVVKYYSIDANAPVYLEIIRSVCK
ncbi:MAG TPA: glycosyltransferase family 4 protein [Ferruginibacter sp.]|jgi:glycosyltransferase involved in cell wall biosynthesis|nr:glycosyltransferase family 4 protein [Ferruginibacter sp.]